MRKNKFNKKKGLAIDSAILARSHPAFPVSLPQGFLWWCLDMINTINDQCRPHIICDDISTGIFCVMLIIFY